MNLNIFSVLRKGGTTYTSTQEGNLSNRELQASFGNRVRPSLIWGGGGYSKRTKLVWERQTVLGDNFLCIKVEENTWERE